MIGLGEALRLPAARDEEGERGETLWGTGQVAGNGRFGCSKPASQPPPGSGPASSRPRERAYGWVVVVAALCAARRRLSGFEFMISTISLGLSSGSGNGRRTCQTRCSKNSIG